MNVTNTPEKAAWIDATAKFAIGLSGGEPVQEAAIGLLNSGADGVALARLAAGDGDRVEDVAALVATANEEMHLPTMTNVTAGTWLVRNAAQRALAGDVVAYDACSFVWRTVVARVPELRDRYLDLIGLASEWEDSPEHRTDLERDMMAAFARTAAT